jgi:hypothetical protein
MPPELGQLSSSGIFIMLVLYAVFKFIAPFVKKKDGKDPILVRLEADVLLQLEQAMSMVTQIQEKVHDMPTGGSIQRSLDRTEELHRWHSPDSGGNQTWKVPSTLQQSIDKLISVIERQEKVLQKIFNTLSKMDAAAERHDKKLDLAFDLLRGNN